MISPTSRPAGGARRTRAAAPVPAPLRSLVGLALLAAGCTTAPVAPVPDPLPETLRWAAAPSDAAGAFLGLEGRENDSGSLESLSFDPGLRITAVADGSPARRAGIQVGDVLLQWDDVEVGDPATLAALLREAEPDATPTLLVQRGDSAFRVEVELRAAAAGAPEPELAWRADPARSRAGWLEGRGGVVLVTSVEDGPFPAAGVPVQSVVTQLDGEPVRSARTLIRALQARPPGDDVDVTFRRPDGGDDETARVTLYEPPRRVTEATLPILAGYRASADGETAGAYLLDLWFVSLFRYRRDGAEREYRFLRFIRFSTGVGELTGGTR